MSLMTSGILFALDLAVKATAIFLATGVAVLLMRRASASARHLVGTFGLAAALLLPFLSIALPQVAVPILPDVRPAVETELVATPAALGAEEESTPPTDWRRLALSVPEKEVAAPVEAEIASVPEAAPVPPRSAPRFPWLAAALALWALGTLAVAARLAVGWKRVRVIAREALPIRDGEWIEERNAAARRIDLDRPVDLLESAAVPVAMTSGILRPLLLIGRVARDWAIERKRVVLLHELAHVKRADWCALLVAELAVALYWFHPLAWWLARGVRRDGEQASDDLVIAAGTKPSVYAGHLLGIFRSLSSPAHPVAPALAIAIARPHQFEERLRAILNPRSPAARSAKMARFAAAGLVAAAVAVAVVEPWAPAEAAIRNAELVVGFADPVVPEEVPAAKSSCSGSKTAPAEPATQVLPASAPADAESEQDEAQGSEADQSQTFEEGQTVPAILKTSPSEAPEAGNGFVLAGNQKSKRDGSDWFDRGMDLHGDERYDEAIAAFQKSIEAGYREATSSYNIACGYALLGEKNKAFEWLGRAMDAGFDVGSYLGHDDDLDGLKSDPRWAELKKTARAHKSRSEENEARVAADRYARLTAKPPKSGEPFFHVGMELLEVDRYDLAAKAFAASAERGYKTGTSLYNQACALSLAGDKRGALDLLSRALDAGFDQPDRFKSDDDLDNVRGEPRFRELAREADELSLPDYGWKDEWGLRSESRKKWRDAAARFQAYTQRHPEKGRGWFNLGFASLAGERPEAAAEAFGKALDLGYRKPTTMYNLACTYARMDRKDEAFDWLFKSLEAGFESASMIRSDDDLDNLRGDPRYRKAIEIARAKERKDDDRED